MKNLKINNSFLFFKKRIKNQEKINEIFEILLKFLKQEQNESKITYRFRETLSGFEYEIKFRKKIKPCFKPKKSISEENNIKNELNNILNNYIKDSLKNDFYEKQLDIKPVNDLYLFIEIRLVH